MMDRWKKLAALLPLAPYLALLAALLVAALAVTYYRWRAEIRHAAQVELLNRQQAEEIVALRAAAETSAAQARVHEARAAELASQLAKAASRGRALAAEQAAAVEREKQAQAELARLSPAETVERAKAAGYEVPSASQAAQMLDLRADRDACREQLALSSQQLGNCREQLVDYAGMIEQRVLQVAELEKSLDLSKQAFEERDQLAKRQVSAAKRSWIRRAFGKAKWFAAGAAAGALLGLLAR
jgi:hypothetical protein